jgi:hypothetical protein
VPPAIAPDIRDVDHARYPVDHGPILRVRRSKIVAQRPLAAHRLLTVAQQERLPCQGQQHDDADRSRAGRTGRFSRRAPSEQDHQDQERRQAHGDNREPVAQPLRDRRIRPSAILLIGPGATAVADEDGTRREEAVEGSVEPRRRLQHEQPQVADRCEEQAEDDAPRTGHPQRRARRQVEQCRRAERAHEEGEMDRHIRRCRITKPAAAEDDQDGRACAEDRGRIEVERCLVGGSQPAAERCDVRAEGGDCEAEDADLEARIGRASASGVREAHDLGQEPDRERDAYPAAHRPCAPGSLSPALEAEGQPTQGRERSQDIAARNR